MCILLRLLHNGQIAYRYGVQTGYMCIPLRCLNGGAIHFRIGCASRLRAMVGARNIIIIKEVMLMVT